MTTKQLYQTFYHHCYLNTGGWIPMMPLATKLELGDFGQIHQSKFMPLGNIVKLRLVSAIKRTELIPLNPWDWRLEAGLEKTAGNTQSQSQTLEDGLETQCAWTTHSLSFKQKGDFVFHGLKPEARFITNWSEFMQDITLRLTQVEYSFREVYVVTAIASVNQWGLAIAGADDAQLEMVAQTSDADYFAALSHETVIALQSRHIARFETSAKRTAYFFKAKKLVLSAQKTDQLINQMLQPSEGLGPDELAHWLSADLLNRVRVNELNAANCLDYFDWADVSLNDVEKLCQI